jgi:site-specific DNA-methyltransferase (adenine-specific)
MIHCGDAIEWLRELEHDSVDLIFSDLPSGETQAPFDVAPDLTQLLQEMLRIVKSPGNIVLMASNLDFAWRVRDAMGTLFSYELIWEKSRATGFFNAKKRPLKAHEYVLVGSSKFNVVESEGHRPMNSAKQKGSGANYGSLTAPTVVGGETTRKPRSVLRFPSVANNAKDKRHPQQKPLSLCEWIIKSYSHENDLVLDPFAGSGVAGVAAVSLKRRFVGCEINADFAAAASAAIASATKL